MLPGHSRAVEVVPLQQVQKRRIAFARLCRVFAPRDVSQLPSGLAMYPGRVRGTRRLRHWIAAVFAQRPDNCAFSCEAFVLECRPVVDECLDATAGTGQFASTVS